MFPRLPLRKPPLSCKLLRTTRQPLWTSKKCESRPVSLTRMYEEPEVSADLRRIYDDVRTSFDIPWVPSVFKLSAGVAPYLHTMWGDLGSVARSKEFQVATRALEEFTHSLAVSDGWHFSSQDRLLAAQKFSVADVEQLGAMVNIFARSIPKLVLFSRLMQRGYSGGQKGKITQGKQASALARMFNLNVPNEKEAGLRTWLIYSDIKKTLHSKTVGSVFRVISPYPGYLASVWTDSKKMFAQPNFIRAREEVSRRSLGLIDGLPVRDHRKLAKNLTPDQWRDIEEMADNYVRVLPQFALVSAVWQRSFPHGASSIAA
jgi:hypothetical protein